ncbi:hypothetical protein OAD75_06150 [Gammaproteobacteria bacterium]|nr:hypothetical protein [Gammaproteobacteria bacterium]
MDKNILKLIGVGVVAYYLLKNKKSETPSDKKEVADLSDLRKKRDTFNTALPELPEISGCTDSSATNYNSLANSGCNSTTSPLSNTIPPNVSPLVGAMRGFDGEVNEGGGLFINSDY